MSIPFPLESHTKSCLTRALISVLENFRDDREMSLLTFKDHLSDGLLLAEAEFYLINGLAQCQCRVSAFAHIRDRYECSLEDTDSDARADYEECIGRLTDVAWAQQAAHDLTESYLTNGNISAEDYTQIAGMISRNAYPFHLRAATQES